MQSMQSIELFSGGGGLALGLHQAQFQHQALVERDRNACATLQLNAAQLDLAWPVYQQNIEDFDLQSVPNNLDLLAGGPPCQPFSLGGKHHGNTDQRNMFPAVFQAVRELRPKAFLFENVRGLARESFRPYLDYIAFQLACPDVAQHNAEAWEAHKARIREHLICTTPNAIRPRQHYSGYDVYLALYNLADLGVPQQRHRIFLVGFRSDLKIHWQFPQPTHSQDALLYAQYIDGSYWQDHGFAPRPVPPKLVNSLKRLASRPVPLLTRWQTVRDSIGDLPIPVNFDPNPAIANHVGIPDAKMYPGHTGSPWDWPAKAIKAGNHGNPGGENMLRNDDETVRYFTVRELARLQTFPDWWEFAGSWSESRRQLGNAVPPLAARLLARHIRAALGGSQIKSTQITPDQIQLPQIEPVLEVQR